MSEKLNLPDIAALLAEKSEITRKEAELFLKEWIETVQEALLEGQAVKIKNLGSFKLLTVSERESVDVVTGNRMVIPAHYKIGFTPDGVLAQSVNEPFRFFETVELDSGPETKDAPEPVVSEALKAEESTLEESMLKESTSGDLTFEEREPEEITEKHPVQKSTILLIAVLLMVAGFFIYFRYFDKPDAITDFQTEKRDAPYNNKPDILAEADSVALDSVAEAPLEQEQANDLNVTKQRTIRQGERLTLLALEEYGDKVFWVYLYEENKNRIENPDDVQAGLTITIPPASKYGIDKNNPESIRQAKALQWKIQQN